MNVAMVFAVLALLWCPLTVYGLKCYECTSVTENNCGADNFTPENANVTECGENQSCYKTDVFGIIARHCGDYAADGCVDIIVKSCFCSADLCNDAVSPLLSQMLTVLGLVSVKLL